LKDENKVWHGYRGDGVVVNSISKKKLDTVIGCVEFSGIDAVWCLLWCLYKAQS